MREGDSVEEDDGCPGFTVTGAGSALATRSSDLMVIEETGLRRRYTVAKTETETSTAAPVTRRSIQWLARAGAREDPCLELDATD